MKKFERNRKKLQSIETETNFWYIKYCDLKTCARKIKVKIKEKNEIPKFSSRSRLFITRLIKDGYNEGFGSYKFHKMGNLNMANQSDNLIINIRHKF